MPEHRKTPVAETDQALAQDVKEALADADAHCASEGLNLTPVRRKVLEFLLVEGKALGAYAILDLLRGAGFKSQPPVAYRALDFLAEHGFVHKVEKLNAFVACAHPSEDHSPAFMICRVCDSVAETQSSSTRSGLGSAAKESGFRIEKTVLEAEGICPGCAAEART